ncbi:phosphotransferase, partial [Endobacter medicaginis]
AEPRQPPLWTHGDWHVSNLLWTQAEAAGGAGEVAAVLDFGLADRSCALFDLATAIERNAVAWLDLDSNAPIARPAIARALLDGYHALQPLDRPARRTLAALLPVVHVGFALSEIGYFHVLRGEPDSVALAFETFLLGHASWFDTPDGVSLLAALLD